MTKKQSPAFQLYAADFYMDTITWTSEEVGCYFRLLMNEWVNGPFPFDAKKMQKVCQMSSKKWPKIWNNIATKFCLNEHDFLYNERLEQTRADQLNYIESQRESGLRGVEKKKELGIFPFDKSSDPSRVPSTDPSQKIKGALKKNQALHSSSSKESIKKDPIDKLVINSKERANPPSADPFFTPEQEKHITKLAKTLETHFKRKFVWPWIVQCKKSGCRAEHIIYCLEQLWRYKENRAAQVNPYGYLNYIMQAEHQNANEAEKISEHEARKLEEKEFAQLLNRGKP